MSAPYENLDFAREEVIKCMSCGNCQEVCPLYYNTHEESSAARGKIKLVDAIIKGLIDTDAAGLDYAFHMCLTCKACNEICPCGVQIDKIVLAARAEMVRQKGLHPLKKVIFNVVERPTLMDTGMRLGGNFQGTVFKKEKELGGYTPRFPFGLDMRRVIPDLAEKPFRMTVPERNMPIGASKYRVAFFTGCSANYLFPNVAESFMNVMKHNHVEVIVPKAQHCCGMPILSHGDQKTAKEMAIDHVKLFSSLDVDYILTVCGSCGLSFKEHYPELLEGTEYYEMSKQVAAKVMDWSDFLMNVVKADLTNLHTPKLVVTYHDPCHLRRGLNVWQEPRQILKDLPDIDFREMKKPNRCCGSAGSFSLTHYDLSMQVQHQKFDDIAQTGADTVVTGCGSCMMQLKDGQSRFGGKCGIVHTVELLSQAYNDEDRRQRVARARAFAK
jgi:glycolate oxidase iron-sulfur subunit